MSRSSQKRTKSVTQSGYLNRAGLACLVSLLLMVSVNTPAQTDRDLARKLRRMEIEGKELTPEESALLARYLEERRQRSEAKRAAYRKINPPRATTGMVPLTELGKGTYKGEQGGLYPGGRNQPPDAHLRAGLDLARRVVPRDAEGKPAEDGKIVLLAIGMSNTTGEFQAFKIQSRTDLDISPDVLLVDGAQGSRGAPHTARPDSPYWEVVGERLTEAGVTAAQVQVVWMKQVKANPQGLFPQDANLLKDLHVKAMALLTERFPNLKLAYISSRTYGGNAETRLHPEPYAYETAFAVKWLISDQIEGSPDLNFDPQRGVVRSPWLAWGPYLWADGTRARTDGLKYVRDDFEFDGIHPSASGRRKVGEQLLGFFKSDPTTRSWFVTVE